MNIFRLAGDMTHLLSVVVLLLKIHATRSCRGRSTGQRAYDTVRSDSRLNVFSMCRHLLEDTGVVRTCFPNQIYRPLL